MGFLEAIKTCLRKYVTFSGRALRSEYWWFYLFTGLIQIPFAMFGEAGEVIAGIVSLALVVPTFSAAARRFHDVDKSGWYVLLPALAAIPFLIALALPESLRRPLLVAAVIVLVITLIYQIYLLASRGSEGDNRFGPPHGQDRVEQVFS